jgi:hypothetical protein
VIIEKRRSSRVGEHSEGQHSGYGGDPAHAREHMLSKGQTGGTSFATERYNRAKDQTLHIYYLAGRAYLLKSLKVRDRFSEILRALPATGQINAATFDLTSLENLYDNIMDEAQELRPARTPHRAHRVSAEHAP